MRNTLFFSLPILVFFFIPSSALAAIGASCGGSGDPPCGSGQYCDMSIGGICASLGTPPAGSAGGLNLTRVTALKDDIVGLINFILVPLLMAVAFITFLYGTFYYFILGGADSEKRQTGRTFVMYGVAGFAIIVSLWGIVAVVIELFSLTGGAPTPPTLSLSTFLVRVY
jgi:hypothetical protein